MNSCKLRNNSSAKWTGNGGSSFGSNGRQCPAQRAKKPVSAIEAAGCDLDTFDPDQVHTEYKCPSCSALLEQVVPVFAVGSPWHWRSNHSWLQEQLRKANVFDEQLGNYPKTSLT